MVSLRKKITIILLTLTILLIFSFLFFRGFIFSKLFEKTLLRAGKPVAFGSYTVCIERIDRNELFGIKIVAKSRSLEARSGTYEYLPKENALKFSLRDGSALDINPDNPQESRRLTFKQMYMKIRLRSLP